MNSKDQILDFIYREGVSVIESFGLELVDVNYRREDRGWILRLFVDRAELIGGGVTLDECAKLSRELGILLDVGEVIGHPYILEISSPGLDRPLKNIKDFQRFIGKRAKVTTRDSLSGNDQDLRRNFSGVIRETTANCVVLECEEGLFTIPIDALLKAKLEIDFKRKGKPGGKH